MIPTQVLKKKPKALKKAMKPPKVANEGYFAQSVWQQSPDPSTLPIPRWATDKETEQENK